MALIENGTWSPSAGRTMKAILTDMKEIEIVEPMITIRSKMKDADIEEMKNLIGQLRPVKSVVKT